MDEGDARLISSPREANLGSSLGRGGTSRVGCVADYSTESSRSGSGKKWRQGQKESGETKENVGLMYKDAMV